MTLGYPKMVWFGVERLKVKVTGSVSVIFYTNVPSITQKRMIPYGMTLGYTGFGVSRSHIRVRVKATAGFGVFYVPQQ